MQVETFEVSEVMGTEVEDRTECAKLAVELKLAGQEALLSEDKSEVIPYRVMTAEELFVYGTLCPQQVAADVYDDGPIPLRVLQVLAHAKSTHVFGHVEVWSAASAQVKDPVLVARIGDKWGGKLFLLARWGEVLLPFAELVKHATARWLSNRRALVVSQIEKLRGEATKMDALLSLNDPEAVAAYAARLREHTHEDVVWA